MANPLARQGKVAPSSDSDLSDQRTNFLGISNLRHRFCYAVGICLSLLMVSWFSHFPALGAIRHAAEAPINMAHDPRLEKYQTPENADHCVEWLPAPQKHLAFASLELPTRAALLFFISRGPVFGNISIVDTPKSGGRPIEVNVTARYHDLENLRRTKVCRMGSTNEHGVFIWAEPRRPHGDDPRRGVYLNITVSMPTDAGNYNDLTTDMPLFSHSIGDFLHNFNPTTFGIIRLKTSNAAIDFGRLVALSAFIQTSNAEIRGFFGGYDLSIQTCNAAILCIAMMVAQAGSEARVDLKTSEGAITSALALLSNFSILRAAIHTSRAPLTIFTPIRSPAVNTSFFLDASTTAEPASVHIYPEYEGVYDLRTSVAHAHVEAEDVDDPLGLGRHRTVTESSTGEHAKGKIYWSHDGEPSEGLRRGNVKVTTSLSPIELHV